MRVRRTSDGQHGSAMQQVSMTSSWNRRSDKPADRTTSDRSARAPGRSAVRSAVKGDERQLEAWPNEGGNSAASADPLRILIVDNDIASATWLDRTVHTVGLCETRVAYSGHAAVSIAAEFHPRVVLLELELLDWNGYELGEFMRGRAQSDPLRLIALTSNREHGGRERARLAGFDRYLLKPIVEVELSALLETPSR
jgi:CheY-like chemotaxis protein